MSGYSTIRYEVDDGLLRLTLNRPDVMNAFTVDMANETTAKVVANARAPQTADSAHSRPGPGNRRVVLVGTPLGDGEGVGMASSPCPIPRLPAT